MFQFEFRDVRAEMMRPGELRDRRKLADIAFLPLGALEWHGIHNPVGVDFLASHSICCMAARYLGGGVVFPTLVYGLPRDSFLVDQVASVRPKAAEALNTTEQRVRGFTSHGGMDLQEQWLNYQRIVRMGLEQIAGFGFKSIYLVSGHGPLRHFIHPVAVAFTRASVMAGDTITTDFGGEWDAALEKADHAGACETSIMMGLDPTMVDLESLKKEPKFLGVGSGADAVDATAQRGTAWMDKCARALAFEARWLVDNYPKLPLRHHHSREPSPTGTPE